MTPPPETAVDRFAAQLASHLRQIGWLAREIKTAQRRRDLRRIRELTGRVRQFRREFNTWLEANRGQ